MVTAKVARPINSLESGPGMTARSD
jgi:hypothetical protein